MPKYYYVRESPDSPQIRIRADSLTITQVPHRSTDEVSLGK